VLSVGRSGSSLAARAMNLLGVHLGADGDLMEATKQNERGFWENNEIYRLNEDLLGVLGGSWYRPPELSTGWECDQRLEELYERAAGVVGALALGGRRWGFKDPRTIVLLPFWQRVIGEMDYLICVRRPHAFVRSVEAIAPPGGAPHVSASLWLDMNASAISHTVDARRMLLFYEDWFEEPRSLAGRMAAFIHGCTPVVGAEALHAVVAFVDPTLRRADARGQLPELSEASELDAMYAHLRLIARHDSDDHEARRRESLMAQALAGSYRLRRRLADDLEQARETAAALRAEAEAVRAQASALEQTQDELGVELTRQRQRLEAIKRSNSWRMTAPLRFARRRVRRHPGVRRDYVTRG
jgi:hypothetical protein